MFMQNQDLKALQDSLFSTIQAKLNLKLTDYSAYKGVQTWSAGSRCAFLPISISISAPLPSSLFFIV